MARLLPALGLVALVAASAATADSGELAPVPLFTAVCTQGGAHLPATDVHAGRYLDVPADGRVALGFDLAGANGSAVGMMQPLMPRDVPNRVLVVGRAADRFLLPSATDRSGALARSCVVLWRGRHFGEARQALASIAGMKDGGGDVDTSPVVGAHLYAVSGAGYQLVADEVGGWTVMRMTVDAPHANTPQRAAVSAGTTVRNNGRGEVVVTSGGKN